MKAKTNSPKGHEKYRQRISFLKKIRPVSLQTQHYQRLSGQGADHEERNCLGLPGGSSIVCLNSNEDAVHQNHGPNEAGEERGLDQSPQTPGLMGRASDLADEQRI